MTAYLDRWYVSMGERFFANDVTANTTDENYFAPFLTAPATQYVTLFYTHPTYGILEIDEYYQAGSYNFRNYTRQPAGEFTITQSGNTVTLSNRNSINFTHSDAQQWPTITHIGIRTTAVRLENEFLNTSPTPPYISRVANQLIIPNIFAITPKTIAIGGTAHFGRGSIRIVWP